MMKYQNTRPLQDKIVVKEIRFSFKLIFDSKNPKVSTGEVGTQRKMKKMEITWVAILELNKI